MKKILLLSILIISQLTFSQDNSKSDLEKLLGKAQEVLSNVELPDLKKNKDYFILLTSDPLSNPSAAMMSINTCLLYTSPSPRDATLSRMPSSA